ncbi:MAG: myxococcus cysteine-rich repeat containing protein [Candidatus Pacearchaeota archaeon]|nr:myxococcus cysteine-rich repeat containing protein [Candidatus Pacearchaeota archaeon]MDZ4227691.1 myxococcus cysteine-rich repeat containing protein [Candidatus Levybacteria bacterium]
MNKMYLFLVFIFLMVFVVYAQSPQGSVTLSWNDTSFDEDGFNIERRIDLGNFVLIASVSAGVEEYLDLNVIPLTNYSYRVYAYNNFSNSSYSNISWVFILDFVCGNGVNETGEQCDDGNVISGDGCSASCEIESGWECTGSVISVCIENPTTNSTNSSNPPGNPGGSVSGGGGGGSGGGGGGGGAKGVASTPVIEGFVEGGIQSVPDGNIGDENEFEDELGEEESEEIAPVRKGITGFFISEEGLNYINIGAILFIFLIAIVIIIFKILKRGKKEVRKL